MREKKKTVALEAKTSGKAMTAKPAAKPATKSKPKATPAPAASAAKKTAKKAAKKTTKAPAKTAAVKKAPVKKAAATKAPAKKAPAKKAAPAKAAKAATKKPVAKVTKKAPAAKPVSKPAPKKPAASKPAATPTPKPAAKTTRKPAAKPTTPAQAVAAPKPAKAPVPQHTAKTEPQTQPQTKLESRPEPKADHKPRTEPQPRPAPTADARPAAATPEPRSEPRRDQRQDQRQEPRDRQQPDQNRPAPRRDDRPDASGRGSNDRAGISNEDAGADRGPDRGPGEGGGKRKRRRRRKGRGNRGEGDTGTQDSGRQDGAVGSGPIDPETESAPRTRRMVTKPKAGWSQESFELAQGFAELGLKPEILRAIAELGFEHPTKIQSELVPLALTGKDILGQAKTGTGKTAAFALPLLNMVRKGDRFSALILAPTRELAVQIKQDFDDLGRTSGLTAVAIYGGQSIRVQADRLARGPEIIVGTPGRIQDMVERGFLSLADVKFAVLDEVDRMFDIGFRDDIRRILKMCPEQRQTIFVSATFTDEIEQLARRYMTDPVKLVVSSGSLTVELVKQGYVTVEPWDKKRMLAHLLTHEEPALTIVFCRMKRTVDDVVRYLSRKGIEAHAIHGDMSQGKRNTVMDQFRSGQLAVLVASDLASRGIDVEGITHVVNYDLPDDPDLYVHRIGRTARAGRDGHAWSLVTPKQGGLLTDIEMLVNTEIRKMEYPDFEANQRPDDWKDEPTGGRPIYEVKGIPEINKNRFEVEAPPKAAELSDADKASKFPGGVMPSKLPPKLMRGKAKTRGR
jgi:ATP-dependent RNA helicase DeaD